MNQVLPVFPSNFEILISVFHKETLFIEHCLKKNANK